MSNKVDFELKYKNILSKFMNGIDLAFQKGYLKGKQEAKLEQMEQQQAEMEQQAQAAMGMDEGGEPMAPEEMNMADQEMTEGEPSELDASLTELEGAIAKFEGRPGVVALKKSVQNLKKSLHKPGKLKETQQTFKGVTGKTAPTVLTEQHKVVKSMVADWDDKSSKVSSQLEDIIKKK